MKTGREEQGPNQIIHTHQGSHRKEGQKSLTEGLRFLKDKTFKCFTMGKASSESWMDGVGLKYAPKELSKGDGGWMS